MTNPRAPLASLSDDDLAAFLTQQQQAYAQLRARGLKLDLTRGKPSAQQLDLSDDLLRLPSTTRDRAGADVRNYGGLEGLAELREIFAELLWVEPGQVVAGGNSSLSMMHATIVDFLLFGGVDSPRPWTQEETVKFVCPVPGLRPSLLDARGLRHRDGHGRHARRRSRHGCRRGARARRPDASRASGSCPPTRTRRVPWCRRRSPHGSRPCRPPPPDFTIFWDNAYAFHHLTEDEAKSADILTLAAASGHPNRPIMFASTSKITFAGAGVAVLAASTANVRWFLGHLAMGSIGPDKVNHLRHVEFFGSADGVREHMRKHRAIIAPKFAAVDEALSAGLAGLEVAEWTRPSGGYFVNLDVLDGTATRVVELAKAAGIALTPAGASFPHGHDPRDRNIRLAPTFPVLDEVGTAMAGVAICVALAAAEKLTAERQGAAKDGAAVGTTPEPATEGAQR